MEAIFGKQGFKLVGRVWEKIRKGESLDEMEEVLAQAMTEHPEFEPYWESGEDMARPQEISGIVVNPLVHTGLHIVVERQISVDDPEEVRRVLGQLQSQGRTRHEALHLIAQAWGEIYFRSIRRGNPMEELSYIEALRSLVP